MNPPATESLCPIAPFRFHVEFRKVGTGGGDLSQTLPVCKGAFSDCSGLDATMEPKVIKAGGANYGAYQRVGPVTFGTVVLKRGVTTTRDMWKWFSRVNEQGKFAFRLNVKITVFGEGEAASSAGRPAVQAGPSWEPRLTVHLLRALPVKFKSCDLNARATEVAIEELHLAHEGLILE